MPRGYRCIILAAFGWLALCGAKPPPEQRQSGNRAQQTTPTTHLTVAPPPASTASPASKFTAYPDYNSERCYHAENKDAADLCAQWRAAIAAEKATHEARRATDFTIIATILSVIGLAGALWSLRQTGGALNEARRANRLNLLSEKRSRRQQREAAGDSAKVLEQSIRAADAASEQVQLSRIALERVERAFVIMDGLHITQLSDPNTGIVQGWNIKMMWKNSGRTPAHRTITHTSVSFANGEIVNDFQFPEFGNISLNPRTLGPDSTRFSGDIFIDVESAKDIKEGVLNCYAWGWFEYADVFSPYIRRRTEYFIKFVFSGEPFPSAGHVTHVMLESHNGFDDYCFHTPKTTGYEPPSELIPGHKSNPLSRFVLPQIKAGRLLKTEKGWMASFLLNVANASPTEIAIVRLPRGQSIGGLPREIPTYPDAPITKLLPVAPFDAWENSIGGEDGSIIDDKTVQHILAGEWPLYIFGRVEYVANGTAGSVDYCYRFEFSSPDLGLARAVINPAFWQST